MHVTIQQERYNDISKNRCKKTDWKINYMLRAITC